MIAMTDDEIIQYQITSLTFNSVNVAFFIRHMISHLYSIDPNFKDKYCLLVDNASTRNLEDF